jgi:transposase InsO family protein
MSPSLDGKGKATDNICIERFWRSVTLPTSVVKRSFCSCDLISSSLYSLTALDGSIAISALARKIFFTYIKIAGGMVYMTAIIDWHSKAVLSYKISNTMDSQLVMSVLNGL